MFPPEVRRYGGMTAEFKATSQHIPVELLKKISFRLEGHWAPDSKEENEKIFVAEKATEILPETESEVCKFLINSLPRSERKAAREEIKRKREREEAEKKAKEAERERIINEAIKKRLDKAERVKTAQYYEKFMDPDNEQENDKPEENNAELNPQAVEFKPVTVGPSNNAVQDDVDIFDSEESIDTDEVEANVQADADTELFEDGTDTDIQAPQIDDVVFDDETEVLDVDEDLDDLSVDIQDTQSAQPAKQGRGQVVNSDDDVSLDDVDLFDDTTVSRTEERPQNVKTSGKTMGSQKQPQTTQNNSDIDYMSLNDISIFDSEE